MPVPIPSCCARAKIAHTVVSTAGCGWNQRAEPLPKDAVTGMTQTAAAPIRPARPSRVSTKTPPITTRETRNGSKPTGHPASIFPCRKVLGELGQYRFVERPFERDNQFGQQPRVDPLESAKFRVLGHQVDIGVDSQKAHKKPMLPLPRVTSRPQFPNQVWRQVIKELFG